MKVYGLLCCLSYWFDKGIMEYWNVGIVGFLEDNIPF